MSLLLANLAYTSDESIRDQAILGVLVGSLIALAVSGIVVSLRARHYRRTESRTDNGRVERQANEGGAHAPAL